MNRLSQSALMKIIFALIGLIDETGDAAIWDSFANNPGGVIGEAVYLNQGEYKGKDLRELWQRVRAVSNPIPVGAAETP